MSLQIVLDVGSGATLPDYAAVDRIVDAVKHAWASDNDVVLKAQLFTNIPPNKPLELPVFDHLYTKADKADIKVTASVFDEQSVKFLLGYPVPFVKIACRPDLYWLGNLVPRGIPLYVSYDCRDPNAAGKIPEKADVALACVPEYPAQFNDYRSWVRWSGVSDHTAGLYLFQEIHRDTTEITVWEKHLVERRGDPKNPDSGEFALECMELVDVL
jgi:sialic acid synthase SpsE